MPENSTLLQRQSPRNYSLVALLIHLRSAPARIATSCATYGGSASRSGASKSSGRVNIASLRHQTGHKFLAACCCLVHVALADRVTLISLVAGREPRLFDVAFAGRLFVALNTKCPRWWITRGKSSHQVTVNLILAYLANIRLTSGPFEPVFVLRHILHRNALTFLLLQLFAQGSDSISDRAGSCGVKATNHKDIFPSAATSRPNRRSSDSRVQYGPKFLQDRRARSWL